MTSCTHSHRAPTPLRLVLALWLALLPMVLTGCSGGDVDTTSQTPAADTGSQDSASEIVSEDFESGSTGELALETPGKIEGE